MQWCIRDNHNNTIISITTTSKVAIKETTTITKTSTTIWVIITITKNHTTTSTTNSHIITKVEISTKINTTIFKGKIAMVETNINQRTIASLDGKHLQTRWCQVKTTTIERWTTSLFLIASQPQWTLMFPLLYQVRHLHQLQRLHLQHQQNQLIQLAIDSGSINIRRMRSKNTRKSKRNWKRIRKVSLFLLTSSKNYKIWKSVKTFNQILSLHTTKSLLTEKWKSCANLKNHIKKEVPNQIGKTKTLAKTKDLKIQILIHIIINGLWLTSKRKINWRKKPKKSMLR